MCTIRDTTDRLTIERALQESEERLRVALATGRMTAWERNVQTGVITWTGEHPKSLFGVEPDQVPRTFEEFLTLVHCDDRGRFDAAVTERVAGGLGEVEFRVIGSRDAVRWITSKATLIRDEAGMPVRMIGVWLDTTERKSTELKLVSRAQQQGAVVRLGHAALRGLALAELFDMAAELVVSALDVNFAKVLETLPDGSGLLLRAGVGWADGLVGSATVPSRKDSQAGYTLHADQAVIVDDLATETRFSGPALLIEHGVMSGVSVTISGKETPFGVLGAHTRVHRVFDEDDVRFLQAIAVILSEAIERQQSLDLLQRTDEQRRRLLKRLVKAQEDERLRISSDIHDDSVQVLTALALRLDLLRGRLGDAELLGLVEEAARTVRTSIVRLRHLIFELRPPALDREGIETALRLYLEEMLADRNIHYGIESSLDAEPDPDTRAVIYRIAQEALSNVAKHSRATRVNVELESVADGVLVRITDNGQGFSPDEREAQAGHMGLVSMAERAQMSGGWCTVESAPGSGATVEAMVPT